MSGSPNRKSGTAIREERSGRKHIVKDLRFERDLFACPETMLEDDIAHQPWNGAVDEESFETVLSSHRASLEDSPSDEGCPILLARSSTARRML